MTDRATEGQEAAKGGRTRWAGIAALGAVCALVIGFYAWSANSGVLESQAAGAKESYYNLLVRGFREGQLNLKQDLPPGLAQSAEAADGTTGRDPSDALGREPDGLHDLSYYKGKLYLYFGVTPALLVFWPYAALTSHYLWHKHAVVFFFSVGFLAGAGLLRAARRRYFKEAGVGLAAAGTLALGLANLAPAILGQCDVYEVAVSCGYALTMLALAAVWAALHDTRGGWRWLAAASLAYGLAVGARPSLLLGAVILLAPAARAWREKRPVWPLLPAAVVPIALIGLGLMVYNVLRFDNPLQFGDIYQLPLTPHQQFSPRYLWFNFQVGFLDPARWSGHFPFVNDITLPALPAGYFALDNAFGVLTNIPLVWLALAAPLAWRSRPGEARSVLRWFLGAAALLFGMCALPLALHDSMCVRYELEYASPLVLLAVIGVFALERALAGLPVWRRAARCGWGLLLAFSLVFNLLLCVLVHAEGHVNLGAALYRKGDLEGAIQHSRMALELRPDYPEAYSNLGTALEMKGQVEEAIAQYRKALNIAPDYEAARNNLGAALFMKGDLEGAVAEYREILDHNPGYENARHNLGVALLRKGDFDAALACLQKPATPSPDPLTSWRNLGNAMRQKGDLEDAILCYRQAIRINPRSAEAYAELGLACFKKADIKNAVDAWQKSLENKPDQLYLLNNLAWLLATTPDAALRNGAKAVALAKQAGQLGGEGNPMTVHTLAAAYAESGDYALAAATARRGLELAAAQKNDALAASLRKEIQLYEAAKPVREAPP